MNFNQKNEFPKGLIADMHTHSENSHDSVCRIEDMYLSQISKGTKIMAVTDHCDISFYKVCDLFAPIKKTYTTVKQLNEKYGNDTLILSGIEISEGFWYPEIYNKAIDLVDHDVVIGSVHVVRYKGLDIPYSKIDFTKIEKDELLNYLDAYFDDMITMIDFADFDILAHLTCPIRYINGKYKLEVDLSRYQSKIETILKKIIEKEIALEVNTSSFDALIDFLPSKDIVKKYYELGGRLITLGSDAHLAKNASFNFDNAITVLKDISFNYINFYKNRKLYKITI